MSYVTWLLVLFASGGWIGLAQIIQPTSAITADSLTQEAFVLQAEKRWHEALSRHDAARKLEPHRWTAYTGPLDCLVTGIVEEQDAAQRRLILGELRHRFQTALARPEADAAFLRRWSQVLRSTVLPRVSDSDECRALINETRAALSTAEVLASAEELLQLQLERGLLEVTAAHVFLDEPSQRLAYEEARRCLETVIESKPELLGENERELYAVSLLHVGRFAHDESLINRAIMILERIVADSRPGYATIYNLACAYAVAGNEEKALETLSRALALLPALYSTVMENEEWRLLRQREAFQRLLRRYDPRADQMIEQARRQMASAQHATAPVAADLAQQAAELYEQVLEMRPDDAAVRHEAARSFWHAARTAKTGAARTHWTTQTRALFAQAAALRPTWDLYYDWGRFLRDDLAHHETDAALQVTLLREAVTRFEQALAEARFTAERLRVQLELAVTLMRLGMTLSDERAATPLYERVLQLMPEVVRREEFASHPLPYHVWGLAHLHLGRQHQNRLMLRQAAERLQTSLQHDPNDVEVRYNLACTYALLGDQASALRLLRECVERAPAGHMERLLETDHDLDSIRHLPEFAELQSRSATGFSLPAPAAPLRRF